MILKKLLQYIRSRAVHHGQRIVHHAKNLGHHAKRIVRYSKSLMHQHRHHFLTMTHIFLLLGLFMFYHFTGVMFAQEADVTPPVEITTETVVAPIETPVAEVPSVA